MHVNRVIVGASLAVVTLVVCWKSHWLEAAQEPASIKAGTRVALVDLTKIFAEHKGFKQGLELMRIEFQQAQNELKARQAAREELKLALEKVPVGSENRAEAEKKYDRDVQALTSHVKRNKLTLQEQEAAIYLETYNQVLGIIATYADQNDIDLVLRFNSEPIDRQGLNNVMQQLNRQVIFNKARIDITNEILRRANAG